MADNDIATRAPENDAAEDRSGIKGDTKPDQGASMGEHCTTDRPTPSGQTPTGEITKYQDIEVYVTKPADYPHAPSKLLLLLTGGTGIHSTNNQLQADKYAAEGFLVVMPDQFGGDPAPNNSASIPQESNASIIEQVKMGVASVAKSFTIDMWLARQTPQKVLPILHKVLESVKEEFADAVANGGDGIYCVGYCFGARYALLLGGELHKDVVAGQRSPDTQAEEGMVKQGPMIKCAAIAHGIIDSKDEVGHATVPTYIVAIEGDSLFEDRIREEGVKVLHEKKVEHEVSVYKDVPHGFAVLGNYEDQGIAQKQSEAFDGMLGWLKAH